MRISVKRKKLKFLPHSSRVVARFFNNGELRMQRLLQQIMELDENGVNKELEHVFREFAGRHRSLSQIFFRHCERFRGAMDTLEIDYKELSDERKMLIGSYGTMEYSIESAALFNPSIIEDFDQTFLEKGEKRVIISLRATGEGHLSSIVFRRGVLDKDNDLHIGKVRNHIDMPIIGQKKSYDKEIGRAHV